MSRFRKGLLAVLLSLGLMGGFGASGFAYLGQYPYDDRDPSNTYDSNGNTCDYTAGSPVGSVSNNQGYVELRYSSGCTTAWARFTCVNPIWPYNVCFNYEFKVQRNTDGATIVKIVTDGTPVGAHTHTNEVWDQGSITSQACIIKVDSRGNNYWACTPSY